MNTSMVTKRQKEHVLFFHCEKRHSTVSVSTSDLIPSKGQAHNAEKEREIAKADWNS